jgi:hypothetical protein
MGIYTDMKKEISEISNKGEIKKQKKCNCRRKAST